MPSRRIRLVPASALADGLKAIRREAGVPEAFPADVLAEAEAAASAPLPERERVDILFVTIDPPGARDLDQALHIERRGDGHRVHYAIADPGVFVETERFAIAAPYAHATAPLRRLQDRYVSECCLAAHAGVAPPGWVRAGLAALPAAMAAGARRAGAVERGVVDLVEAVLSAGREGERFDAVVIDEGLVQLRDPAVRGLLTGTSPALGSEVSVRLDRADPATRTVTFSV